MWLILKITTVIIINNQYLVSTYGDNYDDDIDNEYDDKENDYYNYDDINNDYYYEDCDYHNTIPKNHGCHNDKFPEKTLEQIFGSKMPQCCDFHGYAFIDQCDVSKIQKLQKCHEFE